MQLLGAFLQQGWDVTFSSPAGAGEHQEDLTVLGIREVPIELNNSSFDTFISELAPDIVLFEQFMMEEQFGWRVEKHCPNALRVLGTQDLQSLRHARHQRLKDRLKASDDDNDFNELFAPALREEFEFMAETDLAKREIAAIYRCDLNLMISEVEIELLVEHFKLPRSLLHWCPLMVDLPTHAPDAVRRPGALSAHRQFSPCPQLGCGALVEKHYLANDSPAITHGSTAHLRRLHTAQGDRAA